MEMGEMVRWEIGWDYLLILGLIVLVPGGRTHTRLCATLYQ